MGDDGGTTHLGQIDQQAAAQGDTAGSFVGQYTIQFTRDNFHLLQQPLFGYLDIQDPSLQLQFATDHTWQAQFGWTLFKHQWSVFGNQLDFSLQQSVARQFGPDAAQSAWIANLLQGQAQIPVKHSNIYMFAQGTFYGRRNDDSTWGAGLQGTIGIGWQIEATFSRGH